MESVPHRQQFKILKIKLPNKRWEEEKTASKENN